MEKKCSQSKYVLIDNLLSITYRCEKKTSKQRREKTLKLLYRVAHCEFDERAPVKCTAGAVCCGVKRYHDRFAGTGHAQTIFVSHQDHSWSGLFPPAVRWHPAQAASYNISRGWRYTYLHGRSSIWDARLPKLTRVSYLSPHINLGLNSTAVIHEL